MRLEQLQAFLAIAETGSFQQAARQCGFTQSTISRQIQGLEAEVGLPLFHRSAQAKLTLGGERFLPHARKICQEWEKAQQELGDLLAGKQPELCVAAIHSVCAYYLPPVLQRFCQQFPDVQLRVTALGSDRALKVLKDGLVDVAIVMNNRFLTTGPEMVVEVLYEEEIEVLMGASHPLAKFSQVPRSELGRYPHVVFKDGYGMQRLVQEVCLKQGIPLRIALELNTPETFRGVVRQGEMIALLPAGALVEAHSDSTLAVRQVATLPGEERWMRSVAMVTTRDRLQIPPIAYFCQMVRELMVPASLPPGVVINNHATVALGSS